MFSNGYFATVVKSCEPAFSPFSAMFSTHSKRISVFMLLCDKELTLSQTSPGFYVSTVQVFTRYEQFLLFPQRVLPVLETFLPFLTNLKLSSASFFSLEESRICRLGKGLMQREIVTYILDHVKKMNGVGFDRNLSLLVQRIEEVRPCGIGDVKLCISFISLAWTCKLRQSY